MFQANMKVIFYVLADGDGGSPWQCDQGDALCMCVLFSSHSNVILR